MAWAGALAAKKAALAPSKAMAMNFRMARFPFSGWSRVIL
jgi:hypothetical protein